jgi:hypothetical protein
MDIICPWCCNVFPFDAYDAHTLILPGAPQGFICIAPDRAGETS